VRSIDSAYDNIPGRSLRGDILFFLSFTPMFAALFLSPGATDRERRGESHLDFLQILIVTAA